MGILSKLITLILILVLIEEAVGTNSNFLMDRIRTIRQTQLGRRCQKGGSIRYDPKSGKCFEAGRQAPCGPNMIFYDKDGTNGVCDCKNEPRTLIYDASSKMCHFVFEQGYCSSGKWLTFDRKTWKPICETKKCSRPNEVWYKNRCVIVGSKEDCTGNEVIGFVSGFINPKCTLESRAAPLAIGGGPPQVQCSPGTSLALDGTCQPHFDF